MLFNRCKLIAMLVVGLAFAGSFAAIAADEPRPAPIRADKEPPQKQLEAVIEDINVRDRTLTVVLTASGEKSGKITTRLENVPLAADARILVKDRQAQLGDLRKGMRASLRLQVQGAVVVAEVQANAGQKGNLDDKLATAQSDVTMWQERAAWSERMSRPGRQYVTVAQAEADQARLQAARARLNQLEQERSRGLASGKEQSITDLLAQLELIKSRHAVLDQQWKATLALLRSRIEQQRKTLDEVEEQLRKLAAEGPPVKEKTKGKDK